jgi:hypothetical protein
MISQLDDAGSLMSKRFYWDQGSVLKQLGLIPSSTYCKSNKSEVKLPVLDARIVNGLKPLQTMEKMEQVNSDRAGLSSEAAHLAAMGTPRSRKKMEASEMSMIMAESPVSYRPPSGYNKMKNASEVFSNEPLPLRTSVAIDPRRHMSSIDFAASEMSDYHSAKKSFPNLNNQTQFSLSKESLDDTEVSNGRKHFYDVNQESTQEVQYFGKRQYPNAVGDTSLEDTTAHGRRTYGNKSSINFESSERLRPASAIRRRDPHARSEEHLLGIAPSSR